MSTIQPTNYDEIADIYASSIDTKASAIYCERPALQALLPPLHGLDVLDAGCGTGHWSEHALANGANVVGFDPSVEMIRHARSRLDCELHVCDSSSLFDLVGERRFDLIISGMVLHYVPELTTEFLNYARLLKPDGKIAISMKHPLINHELIGERGYWRRYYVKTEWSHGTMMSIQRPLGDIVEAAALAGLAIERLVEPQPLPEMEQASPKHWSQMQKVPYFLLMLLRS